MKQLPGLASRNIMADGKGFEAETIGKLPDGRDRKGDGGRENSLWDHALEVRPVVAAGPRIEIHPLSIGDREPLARLVFQDQLERDRCIFPDLYKSPEDE